MTDAQIAALVGRIRSAMVEADVTAAELARRAGFSEGYVSQLLNNTTTMGRRKPGPVLVLAQALDLIEVKLKP